jgi:hypothetical protein
MLHDEIYCEIVQINYGINRGICFSQSLNVLYIGIFITMFDSRPGYSERSFFNSVLFMD